MNGLQGPTGSQGPSGPIGPTGQRGCDVPPALARKILSEVEELRPPDVAQLGISTAMWFVIAIAVLMLAAAAVAMLLK